MAHIGTFRRTDNGYAGYLQTLMLNAELTLVPVDNADVDNAPDFRIYLGKDATGTEVGAGWKRTGEKAGAYVSLSIDDPAFTQPIRANLFQTDAEGTVSNLLWSRPSKRKDEA